MHLEVALVHCHVLEVEGLATQLGGAPQRLLGRHVQDCLPLLLFCSRGRSRGRNCGLITATLRGRWDGRPTWQAYRKG